MSALEITLVIISSVSALAATASVIVGVYFNRKTVAKATEAAIISAQAAAIPALLNKYEDHKKKEEKNPGLSGNEKHKKTLLRCQRLRNAMLDQLLMAADMGTFSDD